MQPNYKTSTMVIQTTLLPLAQLAKNDGQIEGLPANPRIIKDEKYQKLVASIKENPEMLSLRELLVYKHDAHYIIIGGNMRYSAMRELGYEEAPCKIIPEETTVEQLRAYTLKDNSGYGEWDWDMLSGEWEMDELEAAGIDLPFLDGEDHPTNNEAADIEEDDFDEEKDPVATICQEGDVWQLGEHRLMCGDSTKAEDVARLMDGEKAQLVITDPPYNVAIGSKNKALNEIQESGRIVEDIIGDKGMTDEEIGEKIWAPAFKNLCDFATDDCAIYVSMPQCGTHMMMMMMSRYWQVKHELIWLKNAPTFSMGRLNYDYKHEPIVYGWKKKHNWYAKEPKQSILCFDKPKKCDLHPTMKPIALWAELICNSSQEGMIVSDFFGGSGTTIVACEQLHRKARLMELDPHYCDVIIARWEKLTGKEALKI